MGAHPLEHGNGLDVLAGNGGLHRQLGEDVHGRFGVPTVLGLRQKPLPQGDGVFVGAAGGRSPRGLSPDGPRKPAQGTVIPLGFQGLVGLLQRLRVADGFIGEEALAQLLLRLLHEPGVGMGAFQHRADGLPGALPFPGGRRHLHVVGRVFPFGDGPVLLDQLRRDLAGGG